MTDDSAVAGESLYEELHTPAEEVNLWENMRAYAGNGKVIGSIFGKTCTTTALFCTRAELQEI